MRKSRPKVFGDGRAIPLDGNAKARVMAYAEAYTARHRQRGQHRGPLTRACLDVLRALLWKAHNAGTGRCFPAHEKIAELAKVARSTVALAIAALEDAGILGWENRLIRERVMVPGLFGPTPGSVPRRTSNAYWFRDPQPQPPKSENRPGTPIKSILPFIAALPPRAPDPDSGLERALRSYGSAVSGTAQLFAKPAG